MTCVQQEKGICFTIYWQFHYYLEAWFGVSLFTSSFKVGFLWHVWLPVSASNWFWKDFMNPASSWLWSWQYKDTLFPALIWLWKDNFQCCWHGVNQCCVSIPCRVTPKTVKNGNRFRPAWHSAWRFGLGEFPCSIRARGSTWTSSCLTPQKQEIGSWPMILQVRPG